MCFIHDTPILILLLFISTHELIFYMEILIKMFTTVTRNIVILVIKCKMLFFFRSLLLLIDSRLKHTYCASNIIDNCSSAVI